MFKFITAFGANSFSVAGLLPDAHPSDTETFRFAFIVYGVSVQEFCDTINAMYLNSQDNEKYSEYEDVLVKAAAPRNTLRITREGYCLYITRGNLKVIYSGWVGDMYKLCKQLDLDYSKHIQTLEESEEENGSTKTN